MRRATVPAADMPSRPNKARLARSKTFKPSDSPSVWLVEVAPKPAFSTSTPALTTTDDGGSDLSSLRKELVLFQSSDFKRFSPDFMYAKKKSLALVSDEVADVVGGLPDFMGTTIPSCVTKYDKELAESTLTSQIHFTRDTGTESDSFHNAIKPAVGIAQFFSLMPVQGFSAPDASSLRFQHCSARVFYSLISILGMLSMAGFCGARFFRNGADFKQSPCLVFFSCATMVMILFYRLALHWPMLITKWEQSETALAHYGYPRHLHRKFCIITTGVLSVALLEHGLSYARTIRLGIQCGREVGFDGLRTFFMNLYPHMYDIIPYGYWNAFPALAVNFIGTFSWTYMDLLIILTSIGLAERFRQINACLRSVKGKPLPSSFWCQLREDYNLLSCLTKQVDACISRIVLLSFGNNLYFICLQLLYSMNSPPRQAIQMLYFYVSLYFLLFRAVAVSICAASINNESQEPKSILYSVPSATYSEEVHRFLHQVTTDEIALTGFNFFAVTRTLLLTVAGTIVTYEIVLVQFNRVTDDERDSNALNETQKFCY